MLRRVTAPAVRAPALGALLLLLPCYGGVVRQHHFAPSCSLTTAHRHRHARTVRISAVSSVDSVERTSAAAAADAKHTPAGLRDGELSSWKRGINPFELVRPDIEPLSCSIKELLKTDHAVLNMAAQHFFDRQTGKQFRPTIVLLMARAVGVVDTNAPGNDPNPPLASVPGVTGDAGKVAAGEDPFDKQYRLAEITEMIHTASLIHDDVLDEADTRRGGAAVHKAYSNTVAVLAGDYLLARASLMMARLRNIHVVETMARSLEALVQGEIMQIKATPEERMQMQLYIEKSFYKTASLIAYSCKSAALLGGHALDSDVTRAAYDYGYHLGLAFQIVDDMLDFTGSADSLGKPKLQDMALGLATAPILYAANEFPELTRLIKRKFEQRGDLEAAHELLLKSKGLERTRLLAEDHAHKAVRALDILEDSPSKDALVHLCHIVLSRNK